MKGLLKNNKKLALATKAVKINKTRGLFCSSKRSTLPLNKTKRHIVLKTLATLGVGVFLWVSVNTIRTYILNANVQNHHNSLVPGNVFDTNGNDINFDTNGEIIEDDTTDAELELMQEKVLNKLRKDASKRSGNSIEKIDQIVSFSYLKNNDFEGDNEFDKHIFSIMLRANGKDYSLNYLTGIDFASDAKTKKDFLGDFLSYLEYDCALDTCEKMSEIGAQIAQSFGATFVGDAYVGYNDAGDGLYIIPIFTPEKVTAFQALRSELDGSFKDPMPALLDQLNGAGEQLFEEIEMPQENQNFSSMLSLLNGSEQELS